MWNRSACDCECNRACKVDKYLGIENCSLERNLFGKLVLECENQMSNTTETLLNERKVICEKSKCLPHAISLTIMGLLLLVVICVSCYFYYIKYRSKLNYSLQFHDTNNKVKRN